MDLENQTKGAEYTMKILILKDGNRRAVTEEDGKYWICGDERYRKLSGQIAEIQEAPEPRRITLRTAVENTGEIAVTTAGKPAPKKKTAKKKSKEATEGDEDGECGK